ncbi:MAG TPA: TonB-dependent receptor [Thermodesulfobacteriota bacterium]|nr:TonB-dependent receptor [Thermodesulfobacteriota bacterium]
MKHFILVIVFPILFTSIPLQLFAQGEEVTLEEVVVTATRDIQEIRKIPANVTVITKEEIEQYNAKTIVDVLRDKVDVIVTDYYGNGKSTSVDVRGFGETGPLNTLVLVDGRRVNEIDLSGVDWTQIPLDRVERIEIVRGPGSVLYGDNAVGGVINIITKKPEKAFSANAEVVGGSYGYNKESASVSGKWGALSAILNASHNSTEGYRENGFLRAEDVGGKVIYDLNEYVSFDFAGGFHTDNTGLPYALDKTQYILDPHAAAHPDDKADTNDMYGVLGIKARLWDFGRIEADLSYRLREVDDFYVSYVFKDKRNLNTWGLTPRYILEAPLWTFSNKLTVGLDFYRSRSDVFSDSPFTSPIHTHSDVIKTSIGPYLLDEFSVFQNLILSLGYRQEWVNYDMAQTVSTGNSKASSQNNEPAWAACLNYLFGKNSFAFLSLKRSFRFPVSDELIVYVLDKNFNVTGIEINRSLKPQVGYHYEAGVRHAFTDQIEANLTLFWVDMKDEIFFNPYTYTNTNFPKTQREGVEVGAKVKPLRWLTFWGNYSYIKATLQAYPFSGNDIPGVPRNKGSLGADVEIWKGLSLNARANFVGSRYFISDWANAVPKLAGYYTVDTKFSYVWKGLKAFVGVNNLFNRKYAEFAVVDANNNQFFYPSPGRNFIGGMSYIF